MKDSECSNRDSAHLKRAGNLNRHIFMESQKIYLAGNGGTDVSALLASALQNRGVDPNILAVMGNRNGGVGGWGGNDFFAILLLFILMGAWATTAGAAASVAAITAVFRSTCSPTIRVAS